MQGSQLQGSTNSEPVSATGRRGARGRGSRRMSVNQGENVAASATGRGANAIANARTSVDGGIEANAAASASGSAHAHARSKRRGERTRSKGVDGVQLWDKFI
ncbi:hypothetical protein Droror1_Dr00014513 [Drosera rotundifolia]